MYCNFCGKAMNDDAVHCSYCGRRLGVIFAQRKLQRPREGRKIAGVCMGFADYLGLDVTLVRLVWLLVTLFSGGLGLIAYIIAWVVMPEASPTELGPSQAPVPTEPRP